MAVYAPDSFDELGSSGSEVDYGSVRDLFSNNDDVEEMASNTPEPVSANTTTSVSRRLFSNPLDPDISTNNSAQSHSSEILEELKKVNSRLNTFSERLETLDGRLKSLEQIQITSGTPCSSTSSIDSSSSKGKRKVPARVAAMVRDVYKALQDENENFLGFDHKKRFIDKHNQDIVSRLVAETSKLDSHIPIIQFRDAARRFYQSVSETTTLKERGKYAAKVTQQRKKNRIIRKLQLRRSVLLKSSVIPTAQRDSLMKVMLTSFMSSEESGEESIDGEVEKRPVMIIKPLLWRSKKLGRILKQLDRKSERKKSKQSRQQTLLRIVGQPSSRQRPACFSDDFFGFEN